MDIILYILPDCNGGGEVCSLPCCVLKLSNNAMFSPGAPLIFASDYDIIRLVLESRKRRVRDIALYHSWKSRNCVLCFNRKTGNLRRGGICGIARCIKALCVPYSVFRQGYSSASIEIQCGVRFFHVGGAMRNRRLHEEERDTKEKFGSREEQC